jgi:hypothetical protein
VVMKSVFIEEEIDDPTSLPTSLKLRRPGKLRRTGC